MVQRRLLSIWLNKRPKPNNRGAPDDLLALGLWCQQYSPLTAIDPPDGVMVDITGCAHLFGGEAKLMAHILYRLPGTRIAIAGTAGAAWALARYGEPGSEDIAPLPLAALRLDEHSITRLRKVGIRRIGALMRLPRAELAAGYGPQPGLRLAQALGQTSEAQHFISALPDWREREHYAEPIFAPPQLQGAIHRMTAKLCARLANAQAGATSIATRFYRIDAHCPEISLGFATSCRDQVQIAKLLIEKLSQNIDPGFGIEAITMEAVATSALGRVQDSMGERAVADYAKPINIILNRLGPANIWRVAPHASHVPEYKMRRVPVNFSPAAWSRPQHPRPVQLLQPPDAITAIAPLPDEPPVAFTWRGKVHKISRATGPERIACEWWRQPLDAKRPEPEKIRDYYAVEDTQGARFWLFRAGVHAGEAPVRWYLHGFFG